MVVVGVEVVVAVVGVAGTVGAEVAEIGEMIMLAWTVVVLPADWEGLGRLRMVMAKLEG